MFTRQPSDGAYSAGSHLRSKWTTNFAQPISQKEAAKCNGMLPLWGETRPAVCKFKDTDCYYCGKRGHIAKLCRTKAREQQPRRQQKSSRTNQVKPDSTTEENTEYTMYHTQTTKPPYTVMVEVYQVNLWMEIDTGATFSISARRHI